MASAESPRWYNELSHASRASETPVEAFSRPARSTSLNMTDFAALYEKYAPDVYRFAFYLSGQRANAEDITSETFVRAWTSSVPIEMSTVKGYLFTIARNLFLQGLRKTSRHTALADDLRDPQAGPYIQAEHKEKLRFVMAELQTLPEASRSALLMYAVDEMAYEEIARVLGVSLTAVKLKIHRARLALAGLRDA
jgi:RNA polymerase sigma-70 factor (ECF subfamily)